MPFFKKAVVVLFVCLGVKTSAEASIRWQVDPFLSTLKDTPYYYRLFTSGLQSLSSISFGGIWDARYEPMRNRLVLGSGLQGERRRLASASDLNSAEFATLGHESFHSLVANLIERKQNWLFAKEWMQNRAQIVYGSIPAEKRAVALEEAYAVFIGTVLQMHVLTAKSIERTSGEDCEAFIEHVESFWQNAWNEKILGYFYRDSVAEYWTDTFKGAYIYVSRGRDEYLEYRKETGEQIWTTENLPKLDRDWIVQTLFGNNMSDDAMLTFAPYIQKSACRLALK